jgi:hypothetical protein
VPHFWLGIAKFNLGDTDGALREWKISEEQGVVARTEYYARMKDWIARAQAEKQRGLQNSALAPKKAADAAISKALELQLEALSAGGDRAESYLAAQRKLVEARAQFQKAGTDVGAYKSAEQTAQQAATLFSSATADAKKKRMSKPPVQVVVEKRQASVPPAQVVERPEPQRPVTETVAPPAPAVLTEAEVTKRIAEQEERRRQLEEASKPAPVPAPLQSSPATTTALPPAKPAITDLRPAFRAFASGDLASSERMLNGILSAQTAPAEAYLLRGCARYTRAMLSRTPDSLLNAATNDFRAALQRNAALRLDSDVFSPKLVAFFEQVRAR